MSEEEQEAIRILEIADRKTSIYIRECAEKVVLDLISNLQKEKSDLELAYGLYKDKSETLQKELDKKDNLILDLKEKLNNIQFEVEIAWRKIEKVEKENE